MAVTQWSKFPARKPLTCELPSRCWSGRGAATASFFKKLSSGGSLSGFPAGAVPTPQLMKDNIFIMPENIDKAYVEKYISLARSTDSEALKNDALYRAGTQMKIIDCNGNADLTPEQQQTVLNAADKLLGGSNG